MERLKEPRHKKPSVKGKMARKKNEDASFAISFEDAEENIYADAKKTAFGMDSRVRTICIIAIVLVVIYVFGLVIPKDIFNEAMHYSGYAAGYQLSWFIQDLQSNLNGIVRALAGQETLGNQYSSLMIRYVVIALAGAGLALTGAVYQGTFKNALVSPSTLGVMSGATLGMMIWVVFFVDDEGTGISWINNGSLAPVDTGEAAANGDVAGYLWSSYSLALICFIGCALVVAIVVGVALVAGRGKPSALVMIITGQVIGSIIGAVNNTIRYYYVSEDPFGVKSSLLTDMQIASFYRTFTWIDVIAILVPLVITLVVVMLMRRKMMMLSFAEEEARSMGVDSRPMQIAVIFVCTLLTAIIISFCGSVGFVGFLVPHLARRLVGPNFSYLLPAATLLGAAFVLGAYVLVSMTLGSSFETMVGMFISIGGATIFLVTALRGKGGSRGAFTN